MPRSAAPSSAEGNHTARSADPRCPCAGTARTLPNVFFLYFVGTPRRTPAGSVIEAPAGPSAGAVWVLDDVARAVHARPSNPTTACEAFLRVHQFIVRGDGVRQFRRIRWYRFGAATVRAAACRRGRRAAPRCAVARSWKQPAPPRAPSRLRLSSKICGPGPLLGGRAGGWCVSFVGVFTQRAMD